MSYRIYCLKLRKIFNPKYPTLKSEIKVNFQAKVLNFPADESSVIRLVEQWNNIGVSSVYLLSNQLSETAPLSLLESDLWIIIQTLLEPKNSDFPLATLQNGEKAIGKGDGEWLRMLCPRGVNKKGKGLLEWRASQIDEVIQCFSPTGISLDFIRHFVFWEEIYSEEDMDSSPRSCFCERCIHAFVEKHSEVIPKELMETSEISEWILKNYQEKWKQFTSETITDIVGFFNRYIKSRYPEVKLNIHLLPWDRDAYNGAILKSAGQDIEALEPFIDQVSPMCYAPMLNRSSCWISQFITKLKTETQLPIYPAIQICSMYGTKPLSDSDFREMLKSTKQAEGVVLWPWEALTDSQLKCCEELSTSYIPDN